MLFFNFAKETEVAFKYLSESLENCSKRDLAGILIRAIDFRLIANQVSLEVGAMFYSPDFAEINLRTEYAKEFVKMMKAGSRQNAQDLKKANQIGLSGKHLTKEFELMYSASCLWVLSLGDVQDKSRATTIWKYFAAIEEEFYNCLCYENEMSNSVGASLRNKNVYLSEANRLPKCYVQTS